MTTGLARPKSSRRPESGRARSDFVQANPTRGLPSSATLRRGHPCPGRLSA